MLCWLIRVGGHRHVFILPSSFSPYTHILGGLLMLFYPFAQLCAGHAFVRGLPSCPLFRSLLTSTWTFQGRIDNGLLRPESGSTWMAMSDGEAAIAFMNILLGCLVGTCCFQLQFFFWMEAYCSCRNGFFPRRDHLGVLPSPRLRREMEETREPAI